MEKVSNSLYLKSTKKKLSTLNLLKLKESSSRRSKGNIHEHEILLLSSILKKYPSCELRDIELEDERLFNLILYILDKHERNLYEIQIVKLYLKTLTNFMEMIRNTQTYGDFNEILTRISYHLISENYGEDQLLFRTGEKGDKFYMVFKGKIAILVASPKTIRMSYRDYIQYLITLKKEEELEILKNTINANKNVYSVTEEYIDKLFVNQNGQQANSNCNPANSKETEGKSLNQSGDNLIKSSPEFKIKNINKKVTFDNENLKEKDKIRITVCEYLEKLKPKETKQKEEFESYVSMNMEKEKEKDDRTNNDNHSNNVNKSFFRNKTKFMNNINIKSVENNQSSSKNLPKPFNKFKTSQTIKFPVTVTTKKFIDRTLTLNKDKKNVSNKSHDTTFDSISEHDESMKMIEKDIINENENESESEDIRGEVESINKNKFNKKNLMHNKTITSPIKFKSSIRKAESKFHTGEHFVISNFNRLDSKIINESIEGTYNRKNEIPEIIVWEYNHILSVGRGDVFGELAMESVHRKRTATLITLEESHFGVLTREIYEDCLKEAYEKTRKNNIHLILNSTIFQGCLKPNFEKKQFNYFINIKLKQGELLIEENKPAEYIYFIKDGEYEVQTNRSINEINLFIKNFGGPIDLKNEEDYVNNPVYRKFYYKKLKLKISIVKNKDVIGLDDYVYESKYIFNVKLISITGEVFKINRKFYDTICESDIAILNNSENFINSKKKLLLEKLEKIKNIKILMFRNLKGNFDKFNTSSEFRKKFYQDTKDENNNLNFKSFTNLNLDGKYNSEKNKLDITSLDLPKKDLVPSKINFSSEEKARRGSLLLISNSNNLRNFSQPYQSSSDIPILQISEFSLKNFNQTLINPISRNSIAIDNSVHNNNTNHIQPEKKNSQSKSSSKIKTIINNYNDSYQFKNLKKDKTNFSKNQQVQKNQDNVLSNEYHVENMTKLKYSQSPHSLFSNSFLENSPEKNLISSISNFKLKDEKISIHSILKFKTKTTMPAVTRRVIIPKTTKNSDFNPKLKNNRTICEVKSKISGMTEMNPILISDEKKIFYDLMEKVRNLKNNEKEENFQKRKNKTSHEKNLNGFHVNYVDCLVVDKILEKTENKKFNFMSQIDVINFQTLGNINSTLNMCNNRNKIRNNFHSMTLSLNSNSGSNIKQNIQKEKENSEQNNVRCFNPSSNAIWNLNPDSHNNNINNNYKIFSMLQRKVPILEKMNKTYTKK